MQPKDYFSNYTNPNHKKYEALKSYFVDNLPVGEIAVQFGYQMSTIYSYIRDFKELNLSDAPDPFFKEIQLGKKLQPGSDKIRELVILLRKKYLSQSDIKSILDSQNMSISEKQIYNIIKDEGFARLPRRTNKQKSALDAVVNAPKSELIAYQAEEFSSQNAGLLCFLPFIKYYKIDRLISNSLYPGTKSIPTLNSILAFVGLKLLNVRRYTADDLWCMDRGSGLFAGLNVLPKAAWYSSYSSRVTREMNLQFLREMNKLWSEHGLLSGEVNLDFTTIPYFGDDDEHLENNWSGTRNKALSSILAAIAHDPDTGIIFYGDTTVRHKNQHEVVLEFLDFYKASGPDIKVIAFDSKVSTYKDLKKLDDRGVKFITIRRRGKKVVEEINNRPRTSWKSAKVECAGGTRVVQVIDEKVRLKDYGEIRQIIITGGGKIKPALIITNDYGKKVEEVVRRYARRWLVEKAISEQVHFFHLNRLSSSMVIKVDFDLTMTILAHNLYRLFASNLEGFEQASDQKIYEKFIQNSGKVNISTNDIAIMLNKKRNIPTLLESLDEFKLTTYPWMKGLKIKYIAASHT